MRAARALALGLALSACEGAIMRATPADPSALAVVIESPGAGVVMTRQPELTVAGTVTECEQVQAVTWHNAATGVGGLASGTCRWSIGALAVVDGDNAISVRATTREGQTAEATLIVVRGAPRAPTCSRRRPRRLLPRRPRVRSRSRPMTVASGRR
jgi:hypothetical protein